MQTEREVLERWERIWRGALELHENDHRRTIVEESIRQLMLAQSWRVFLFMRW